jgi:predicted O-linked N-acetylglucosamine transferase (SPINDLY family)
VGRISYGLIEKLAAMKDKFQIFIYTSIFHNGIITDRLKKAAFKSNVIHNHLVDNINMLRDDQLDALVLLDPMQDTLTYIISQFRCAPVQISTWGHPGTTGLDTIDYYVTSKYFKDDQSHFTEKLVIFNSLSIYYNHIDNLVIPFATPDFRLVPYIQSKGGVEFSRQLFDLPLNKRI